MVFTATIKLSTYSSSRKEIKLNPLESVKEEIIAKLKKKKALELSRKAAEEFIRKGSTPTEKVEGIDRTAFVEKFKPLDPQEVDNLFSLPTGKKALVILLNGYGVFQPTSEVKVDSYDRKKMEQLKEFILNAKRESNYASFITLLRQRATVKLNQKLFK